MTVANTMTERAAEVCRLAGSGLSDKHIAARLKLNIDAVKTHVRTGLRATGCKSRVELARLYLKVAEVPINTCTVEEVLKTDLERETIKRLARGLQSLAIAGELEVPVHVIRMAEKRLRRRAGAANRTQLVRWYLHKVPANG